MSDSNPEYAPGSLRYVEKMFFFVIPRINEVVSHPDKPCNISKTIGSIFRRRRKSRPIFFASIIVLFFE